MITAKDLLRNTLPFWNLPNTLLEKTRRSWNLPKKITVSEFADKHIVLDEMTSAEPGRWRTDRAPYQRGIMDAYSDPYVLDITIMASTQVGKTAIMLNCLGYSICEEPGPTMWVGTTEKLVKSFNKDRIHPMINSSKEVSSHLTSLEDDMTRDGILFDRMRLYTAWSNSPASLASRPVKNLFFDETDKYPPFSGREADPIKLGIERTKTFWNRKIVKCSTPTTKEGYIYRDYQRTDRCQYYVPCPHCGEYQTFILGQIRLPENRKDERDPEMIKAEYLAHYECKKCECVITDNMKYKMLLKGKWVPAGCEINTEGKILFEGVWIDEAPKKRKRGFWINAIYSPWLTFSDVLAEFFDSKGDPTKMMNFVNSWLAEIFEEKERENEVDFIKTLSVDYPKGLVPEAVKVLTGGVDVQKGHFYGVIRGWGYDEESWLIREERLESWAQVIDMFFKKRYAKADGTQFFVRLTCIDSGYDTEAVYRICREFNDISKPVKGDDKVSGIPYKTTQIDKYPSGKFIPGGLKLWRLDVNLFKDRLHRLMHSGEEGQQKWFLHGNPNPNYIKQLCGEHKIFVRDRQRKDKGQWLWVKKGANHYLDCENYAGAAADILGVFNMRRENQPNVYRPRRTIRKPSGYLNREKTKGWLRQ